MSLKEDVLKLKKEKNAIILAHYYVDGAVQDVADFVGDSYALAKKAKNTDADTIIPHYTSYLSVETLTINNG